jgi:hypothetical protein
MCWCRPRRPMSHDWPILRDDTVGGQMPGERVRSARPYEAQVAAAWRDGRGSDQGACVHARAAEDATTTDELADLYRAARRAPAIS